MDEQLPGLGRLAVIFCLVVLNGLFVAVEYAILGSRLSGKLRSVDERELRGGRRAIWLLGKLDLSLPATQLGITTTSLLLGWIGVVTFKEYFAALLAWSGISLSKEHLSFLAVAAAVVFIVFIHVIFGELLAKAAAIRYPERIIRSLSLPIFVFAQILRPVIALHTKVANTILHLFGTSIPSKWERSHSVAELSLLVEQSTEGGVIDEDEENMLHGVFGFSDTVAREVMTPRTDLVAIDLNSCFEDVLQVAIESGFSRFPVKDGEIDNILGIFLAKDLFQCVSQSEGKDFNVKALMRKPFFIPGTKPIDDLLNEFKRRKEHMAIVLDEHGGVDGLVTLEDLIEEIVGDIFDESDVREYAITIEESGDVVIDGGMLVADVNAELSLSIPEGDYDTIAGFILTSLGRLTQEGDTLFITQSGAVLAQRSQGEDGALGLERVNVEGGGNGSNGCSSGDQTEDPFTLKVIVEKVDIHRIELVRVCFLTKSENNESLSPLAVSNTRESVSEPET